MTSTSVFYIVPSRQTRRMTTGWQRFQPNQELAGLHPGRLRGARERDRARDRAGAARSAPAASSGCSVEHHIDVREVEQNNQTREDLIVTFHILGTAIAPHGEHVPLDPQTILRLGVTTRP